MKTRMSGLFAVLFWLMTVTNAPWALASFLDAPKLKSDIEISDDVVRLGDLFENAGKYAKIAVFRSPSPGETGHLRSDRIAYAARRHGLTWTNPLKLGGIIVSRAGVRVPAETIRAAIAEKIAASLNLTGGRDRLQLTFSREQPGLVIPAGQEPTVKVVHLSFARISGAFSVVIAAPARARNAVRRVYRGRAVEVAELPVLKHDVRRGEVISLADIEIVRRPKSRIKRYVVTSKEEIVGLAARRTLRAGQLLRSRDLERPRLVEKNTAILVVYQRGGLRITVRGRALAAGVMGEAITVLNPKSRRKFLATVTGPGLASVSVMGRRSAALLR